MVENLQILTIRSPKPFIFKTEKLYLRLSHKHTTNAPIN